MQVTATRGALARRVRAFGVALALLAPLSARAQTNSAALDLLYPIGARATAMGAAFAAEQGGGAIWFNPAGLARLTKPEFALDHFANFQIEGAEALSLILPAGPVGVFGIGARIFNQGTLTTTGFNGEELGTTRRLGNRQMSVTGAKSATGS